MIRIHRNIEIPPPIFWEPPVCFSFASESHDCLLQSSPRDVHGTMAFQNHPHIAALFIMIQVSGYDMQVSQRLVSKC